MNTPQEMSSLVSGQSTPRSCLVAVGVESLGGTRLQGWAIPECLFGLTKMAAETDHSSQPTLSAREWAGRKRTCTKRGSHQPVSGGDCTVLLSGYQNTQK